MTYVTSNIGNFFSINEYGLKCISTFQKNEYHLKISDIDILRSLHQPMILDRANSIFGKAKIEELTTFGLLKRSLSPIAEQSIVNKNLGLMHSHFGFFDSEKVEKPILGSVYNYLIVPWFSYPAIWKLISLDLGKASILEYGTGYSCEFWSNKCRKLTIVEQNEEWINYAKSLNKENIEIHKANSSKGYFNAPWLGNKSFDIIVFDSSPEYRHDLVNFFINSKYKADLLILDDSSYYSNSHSLLSEKSIHYEDFIGLAPFEENMQVTTFFYLTDKFLNMKSDLKNILGTPKPLY